MCQISLSNFRVRMTELSERRRLTFSERTDRRVEYRRFTPSALTVRTHCAAALRYNIQHVYFAERPAD